MGNLALGGEVVQLLTELFVAHRDRLPTAPAYSRSQDTDVPGELPMEDYASRFIPIRRRGAELLSHPVYRLQLATKGTQQSPPVPSIQTHLQSTACH